MNNNNNNKEEDEDEEEDDMVDDKFDNVGDPERLKAFNVSFALGSCHS